jgi:hypothetical protein
MLLGALLLLNVHQEAPPLTGSLRNLGCTHGPPEVAPNEYFRQVRLVSVEASEVIWLSCYPL